MPGATALSVASETASCFTVAAWIGHREVTLFYEEPYSSYMGHFCLGIIYDRIDSSAMDETKSYTVDQLQSIASVVKNFQFFVAEKWKIASDKSGSGNTANIGSINNIADILIENGMFSRLGES